MERVLGCVASGCHLTPFVARGALFVLGPNPRLQYSQRTHAPYDLRVDVLGSAM
jgi:hypothetical protein